MNRWRIVSEAAVEMGIFEGETREDALDAMARDMGYKNQEDAEEVVGSPFTGRVILVEVASCGAPTSA